MLASWSLLVIFCSPLCAGIVKVGDFGIAKSLSSSMDMAKTQIGTPYYLSPEICCDKPYNKKSDMWALGVMLYEMLALQLPFIAQDLPRLVTKILAGSYPPLPARVSRPVRDIVDALLQKDPKSRPSINTILKSEVVRSRIQAFLTQTLAAREFGQALKIGATAVSAADPAMAAVASNVAAPDGQQQQPQRPPLPRPGPMPGPRSYSEPPPAAVAAPIAAQSSAGVADQPSPRPTVGSTFSSNGSCNQSPSPVASVVSSAASAASAAAERYKLEQQQRQQQAAKAAAAAAAAAEAQRQREQQQLLALQQQQQARAQAEADARERERKKRLQELVLKERERQKAEEKRAAAALLAAQRAAERQKQMIEQKQAERQQVADRAAADRRKQLEFAKQQRQKWVEERRKEWIAGGGNDSRGDAVIIGLDHDAGGGRRPPPPRPEWRSPIDDDADANGRIDKQQSQRDSYPDNRREIQLQQQQGDAAGEYERQLALARQQYAEDRRRAMELKRQRDSVESLPHQHQQQDQGDADHNGPMLRHRPSSTSPAPVRDRHRSPVQHEQQEHPYPGSRSSSRGEHPAAAQPAEAVGNAAVFSSQEAAYLVRLEAARIEAFQGRQRAMEKAKQDRDEQSRRSFAEMVGVEGGGDLDSDGKIGEFSDVSGAGVDAEGNADGHHLEGRRPPRPADQLRAQPSSHPQQQQRRFRSHSYGDIDEHARDGHLHNASGRDFDGKHADEGDDDEASLASYEFLRAAVAASSAEDRIGSLHRRAASSVSAFSDRDGGGGGYHVHASPARGSVGAAAPGAASASSSIQYAVFRDHADGSILTVPPEYNRDNNSHYRESSDRNDRQQGHRSLFPPVGSVSPLPLPASSSSASSSNYSRGGDVLNAGAAAAAAPSSYSQASDATSVRARAAAKREAEMQAREEALRHAARKAFEDKQRLAVAIKSQQEGDAGDGSSSSSALVIPLDGGQRRQAPPLRGRMDRAGEAAVIAADAAASAAADVSAVAQAQAASQRSTAEAAAAVAAQQESALAEARLQAFEERQLLQQRMRSAAGSAHEQSGAAAAAGASAAGGAPSTSDTGSAAGGGFLLVIDDGDGKKPVRAKPKLPSERRAALSKPADSSDKIDESGSPAPAGKATGIKPAPAAARSVSVGPARQSPRKPSGAAAMPLHPAVGTQRAKAVLKAIDAARASVDASLASIGKRATGQQQQPRQQPANASGAAARGKSPQLDAAAAAPVQVVADDAPKSAGPVVSPSSVFRKLGIPEGSIFGAARRSRESSQSRDGSATGLSASGDSNARPSGHSAFRDGDDVDDERREDKASFLPSTVTIRRAMAAAGAGAGKQQAGTRSPAAAVRHLATEGGVAPSPSPPMKKRPSAPPPGNGAASGGVVSSPGPSDRSIMAALGELPYNDAEDGGDENAVDDSIGPSDRSILAALDDDDVGAAAIEAPNPASSDRTPLADASLTDDDRAAVDIEVEVAGLQDEMLEALAIGDCSGVNGSDGNATMDDDDEDDEDGDDDTSASAAIGTNATPSMAAVLAALSAADQQGYGPGIDAERYWNESMHNSDNDDSDASDDAAPASKASGDALRKPSSSSSRPSSGGTLLGHSLMLSSTLTMQGPGGLSHAAIGDAAVRSSTSATTVTATTGTMSTPGSTFTSDPTLPLQSKPAATSVAAGSKSAASASTGNGVSMMRYWQAQQAAMPASHGHSMSGRDTKLEAAMAGGTSSSASGSGSSDHRQVGPALGFQDVHESKQNDADDDGGDSDDEDGGSFEYRPLSVNIVVTNSSTTGTKPRPK